MTAPKDEFSARDEDLIQALYRILKFLRDHHTIHNPSSCPRSDDYRVSLGRFGSLEAALASASGLDFHTMDSLLRGGDCSDGVFISRVYLDLLLKESNNERLITAVREETGL